MACLLLVGYSTIEAEPRGDRCTVIERKSFESFFFGQRIRPQPLYRNAEILGWRVYEQRDHEALPKLGLQVGDDNPLLRCTRSGDPRRQGQDLLQNGHRRLSRSHANARWANS